MKNSLITIFLFFLTAVSSKAQTIISGVVYDTNNVPIPYACVYLSKTTIGVMANDKGAYKLTIPQDGKYVLIASCIGYESQSQIIKANGTNKLIDIRLPVRPFLIQEVTIKDKDRNHRKNYELFLKCFIGETPNAPFCKIENPKDLVVYRESSGRNLTAYSVRPLIITNSSFGYKIFYDLKSFSYDIGNEHLRFSGDYYFRDITNKNRTNLRIQRHRMIAYYGSRMHFLRALFVDSVGQENFKIYNTQLDSINSLWIKSDTIPVKEVRLTINADSMMIYHSNPIIVSYSDNHPELFPLPQIYRPGKYESKIIFNDSLKVYKNGYYPDGYSISWGGFISRDRIAELLPYDFVPKITAKQVGYLLK